MVMYSPSMSTIKASFKIANVVPKTIRENINVHIGSAMAHEGCKIIKHTRLTQLSLKYATNDMANFLKSVFHR